MPNYPESTPAVRDALVDVLRTTLDWFEDKDNQKGSFPVERTRAALELVEGLERPAVHLEIPSATREQLEAYRDEGREPSGSVKALLANDLLGTVTALDLNGLRRLFQTVLWIKHNIPPMARGDYARIALHIKLKHGERLDAAAG